jgi:hypothetical protein
LLYFTQRFWFKKFKSFLLLFLYSCDWLIIIQFRLAICVKWQIGGSEQWNWSLDHAFLCQSFVPEWVFKILKLHIFGS